MASTPSQATSRLQSAFTILQTPSQILKLIRQTVFNSLELIILHLPQPLCNQPPCHVVTWCSYHLKSS